MSTVKQNTGTADAIQVDMGRRLQKLASMTNKQKQSPGRYASFCRTIAATGMVLSSQNQATLESQFVENTDEPAFIRAFAAHVLAISYLSTYLSFLGGGNGTPAGHFKGHPYLEMSMGFCQAVTTMEFKIPLGIMRTDDQSKESTVADILTIIQKEYESRCKLEEDFIASIYTCSGFTQTTKEVRSEYEQTIKEIILSGQITRPCEFPTLNSKLFTSVKALPESDKTLLIALDEDTAKNQEYVYRVVEVDIDRFSSGKRTKIFRRVTMSFHHDKQNHHKTLLSLFVLSCMRNDASKERPQRVLFHPDDVNHPQVKMFMAMMGYPEIAAADPKLLDLCHESGDEDLSKFARGKPHFKDYKNGIICESCGHVGPDVKACFCGVVFYCGKKCQKDGWNAHKPEHKVEMSKKEKNSTKKTNK